MKHVVVRMSRYGVANLVFFLLDLAIVYVLTSMLGFFYLFSVVFGFVTTTMLLFFANRAWTFMSNVHPVRGLLYACAVALSTLAIITTITYVGVHSLGLYYLVARLIAACFAFLWSYIADSYFTFGIPPFG